MECGSRIKRQSQQKVEYPVSRFFEVPDKKREWLQDNSDIEKNHRRDNA